MKVYVQDDSQNHCIVAENMEEAVRLYVEKYSREPEGLRIFSHYVIIQGQKK